MNTRSLTDDEIKQILSLVKNKLSSEQMQTQSVIGRTITIINDEVSKRSGGIMISKKEKNNSSFLGEYYSLDEFLLALNKFLSDPKQKESGTFTKKGKTEVDEKIIDQALHDFSSLYLEKSEKIKPKGPNIYTINKSDANSNEIKRQGALFTPRSIPVKEGQYIDEQAAATIASSIEIEIPTEKELEEAIQNIEKQEPVTSTFKRKLVSEETKTKLKEITQKISKILMVPIIAMSIKSPADMAINPEPDVPIPPSITQVDPDIEPTPEPITIIEHVEQKDPTRTLEIGDIVEMENGVHYDYTSQAIEPISGEIGANPYREAGDYTVDVIAILDSSNNLIDHTAQPGDSLEGLLEKNGFSIQDVENGTITARYNVSEGINADLDRTNAAGWITFNPHTYQDQGNIIQQIVNGQNIELKQGGRNI